MRRTGSNTTHWLGRLILVQLLLGSVHADDSIAEEYAVKAALVYNFVRFTEWPADVCPPESAELRIVYYGDEALSTAFATIDGKRVADRTIKVERGTEPEDSIGCQLVFLAKTEREQWPRIMAVVAGKPVLSIGEMNGFMESGGMVNLHLARSKIRFQVNLDNVKGNGLQISSQILKLATTVIEKGEKD